MVVDASAILAIVLKEDDAAQFRSILGRVRGSVIGAVNYWEVLVRAQVMRGAAGIAAVESVMSELNIEIATVGAETARDAAFVFGRFGRNTPAKLNLGDCFAYALAAKEGHGLLFKGDDFTKTDIKNARDG